MKYLKTFLFAILQLIWCLPQNLLGLALYAAYFKKGTHGRYKNSFATYINREGGSFSVGVFIFISTFGDNQKWIQFVRSHEYGHTFQSLMLGPLYLFVIGIPSAVWCNAFKRYREKRAIPYGNFYTERWANYLGSRHSDGDFVYMERPYTK